MIAYDMGDVDQLLTLLEEAHAEIDRRGQRITEQDRRIAELEHENAFLRSVAHRQTKNSAPPLRVVPPEREEIDRPQAQGDAHNIVAVLPEPLRGRKQEPDHNIVPVLEKPFHERNAQPDHNIVPVPAPNESIESVRLRTELEQSRFHARWQVQVNGLDNKHFNQADRDSWKALYGRARRQRMEGQDGDFFDCPCLEIARIAGKSANTVSAALRRLAAAGVIRHETYRGEDGKTHTRVAVNPVFWTPLEAKNPNPRNWGHHPAKCPTCPQNPECRIEKETVKTQTIERSTIEIRHICPVHEGVVETEQRVEETVIKTERFGVRPLAARRKQRRSPVRSSQRPTPESAETVIESRPHPGAQTPFMWKDLS